MKKKCHQKSNLVGLSAFLIIKANNFGWPFWYFRLRNLNKSSLLRKLKNDLICEMIKYKYRKVIEHVEYKREHMPYVYQMVCVTLIAETVIGK